MPTSLNTTLPEVQTLAKLPADERWALIKTLIESLQPESPAPQVTEILPVTSNHHGLLLQMAQDPEIQAELVSIND
jgi:hypothetical protein